MKNQILQIKKWIKMLNGTSVLHLPQKRGKLYDKNTVSGYYNDLTVKVNNKIIMDENGTPMNIKGDGTRIYFPIAIFQYGLGLYDLILQNYEGDKVEKFIGICNWAVENQEENGAWDTFGQVTPAYGKYSAMAQGQGVSLLIRAHILTKEDKFLEAAIKAVDFMLKPVEKGGTTRYYGEKLLLEEVVKTKISGVLNGWIFAIFGLMDIYKYTGNIVYKSKLDNTIEYMCQMLPEYDFKFWSLYDLENNLSSPFYHDLHIEQIDVMYELFGNEEFRYYKEKWLRKKESKICSCVSFIYKAIQKIIYSKNDNSLMG